MDDSFFYNDEYGIKNTISIYMLFAIGVVLFYSSDLIIRNKAISLLPDSLSSVSIAGQYITGALGFVFCHFFYIRTNNCRGKRRHFTVSMLIYFAAMTCVFTVKNPLYMLPFFALASFATGTVSAGFYYYAAIFLDNSKQKGLFINIALIFGILITYALREFGDDRTLLIASVVSFLLIFMGLFGPQPFMRLVGNTDYGIRRGLVDNKTLLFTIAIASVMSLVIGIYQGIILHLTSENIITNNLYQPLFTCAGLLLAGILADIKARRYLDMVTLISLSLCAIVSLLLSDNDSAQSASYLFGFVSGFYITYITICFLDMAPLTKMPVLIASGGQLFRSVSLALLTIPSAHIFKNYGITFATALTIAIIAVLIFFFFERNSHHHALQAAAQLSLEDFLEGFTAKYCLTDRESEILSLVVRSDVSIKEMAESLYISERVMQRHLSSIYSKTNTYSRVGLCVAFYENMLKTR